MQKERQKESSVGYLQGSEVALVCQLWRNSRKMPAVKMVGANHNKAKQRKQRQGHDDGDKKDGAMGQLSVRLEDSVNITRLADTVTWRAEI